MTSLHRYALVRPTTAIGGPVDPRNLLRVLEGAARTSGVPGVGVHTLRRLAEATGRSLEDVVKLAKRGELRKLLPPKGQVIRISTPLVSETATVSPRACQLRLLMKRRPPT